MPDKTSTHLMRLVIVAAIAASPATLLAQSADQPGEGTWRNYDFTPGTTVWVATDFSEEAVGRFPTSQLEFVKGNMQIVEKDGAKLLEVSSNSVFRVKLPEALPEGFSLEFAMLSGAPNMTTRVFFSPLEGFQKRHESQYLLLNRRPGLYFQGQDVSTIDENRGLADRMRAVRFQADGEGAMLYVDIERAANVPTAKILRSDVIEFHVTGNKRLRSYIKDIVVAVGLDKLYETLKSSGAFTTRGILFALDSDALQPESTPVLEDIRATLDAHPELRIVIEGHTDSSGEDTHNLDLSERRAQAVVLFLIDAGIAADRLASVGKGETEPVAQNDTSQGRAQNRRVVLKLAEA